MRRNRSCSASRRRTPSWSCEWRGSPSATPGSRFRWTGRHRVGRRHHRHHDRYYSRSSRRVARVNGCLAYLDSGSDDCCFPLSFATQLGLNPEQMRTNETAGSTGRGTTFYSEVTIRVPLGDQHAIMSDTRAGFMPGLDAVGGGLLGQTGFFDQCAVGFNRAREVFTIVTP